MRRSASIPFVLVRSNQVIGREITTTTEEINGLIQFASETLKVQWRAARSTNRVGAEIRTDVEMGPVIEAEVPLSAIGGVELRTLKWYRQPTLRPALQLILRASDLRAFESIAGTAGMSLEHPAELVIPVRKADRMAAEEFVGELQLALAELGESHALNSASDQNQLSNATTTLSLRRRN